MRDFSLVNMLRTLSIDMCRGEKTIQLLQILLKIINDWHDTRSSNQYLDGNWN